MLSPIDMTANIACSMLRRSTHGEVRRQLYIPDRFVESFECLEEDIHVMANDEELVPPYAAAFSRTGNGGDEIAAVADEDGTVLLLNTRRSSDAAVVAEWRAHSNAVFDVVWWQGQTRILTASGDQSVGIHDTTTQTAVTHFIGHTKSVKSVSLMPRDGHVFISGSRDGSVAVWDSRNRRTDTRHGITGLAPVNTIPNCHVPTFAGTGGAVKSRRRKSVAKDFCDAQSVTCVAFSDNYNFVSSGSTDGCIKLWDIRALTSRSAPLPKVVFPYRGVSQKENGYSYLLLDSTCTKLFASCLDNTIYQYNLSSTSTKPTMLYKGHRASTFYIRASLSANEQFLAVGSDDQCAWIYRVDSPCQRPTVLPGHRGEVTVPCWSPTDLTTLLTLSDDCHVRVWHMNPGRELPIRQPSNVFALAQPYGMETTSVTDQRQSLQLTSPRGPFKRCRTSSGNYRESATTTQLSIERFLSTTKGKAFSKLPTTAAPAGTARSHPSVGSPVAAALAGPFSPSLTSPPGGRSSPAAMASPAKLVIRYIDENVGGLGNSPGGTTATNSPCAKRPRLHSVGTTRSPLRCITNEVTGAAHNAVAEGSIDGADTMASASSPSRRSSTRGTAGRVVGGGRKRGFSETEAGVVVSSPARVVTDAELRTPKSARRTTMGSAVPRKCPASEPRNTSRRCLFGRRAKDKGKLSKITEFFKTGGDTKN